MADKMSGWICQDEYLKTLEYLTDEELGRLVRALTIYHKDGTTSEIGPRETGAYWFIRSDIDKAEAGYVKKSRTNSENSRNREIFANRNERERQGTNRNDRERTGTNRNEQERQGTNRNEQERINTNNNSNCNLNYSDNGEEVGERARAENTAPSPAASGHLGGEITPEEIEQEQAVQDQAEKLVRAYRLPLNSRTLDAVASDIREKGADAVRVALDAATDADTKGGISLAFYRAILNGTGGHGRKGRDAPGDMIHHTREEWERSSSAAIIDLDDE